MQTPYSKFDSGQLILRDFLAIDRTILANERTLLGYIRTAVALFISGISLIKFLNEQIMTVIGWAFIVLGIVTVPVGYLKYFRRRKVLSHICRDTYEIRYNDSMEKTQDVQDISRS